VERHAAGAQVIRALQEEFASRIAPADRKVFARVLATIA